MTASGSATPLTIRHLAVDVLKPAGELYYPLEG
jgi:hypothetical protein